MKDGAPEQGNFDTYQMVRFAQAPKIDVHFALSGGNKWGGAGEPGAAPVAAAVCNAIYAAGCGLLLYTLYPRSVSRTTPLTCSST